MKSTKKKPPDNAPYMGPGSLDWVPRNRVLIVRHPDGSDDIYTANCAINVATVLPGEPDDSGAIKRSCVPARQLHRADLLRKTTSRRCETIGERAHTGAKLSVSQQIDRLGELLASEESQRLLCSALDSIGIEPSKRKSAVLAIAEMSGKGIDAAAQELIDAGRELEAGVPLV